MKLFNFQKGFAAIPLSIVLLIVIVTLGVIFMLTTYTNKQSPPLSNVPTVTTSAKESYLQPFLRDYCEKLEPTYAFIAIDPKDLPVAIDQSIIRIDKATVWCWEGPGKAYIEIRLSNGNSINIYDSYSQEPAHGGVEWLVLPADAIIKKGDIQIAYFVNSGEGSAYLGGTTIVGIGEKEINDGNGKTIYANTSKTLVKEDDPRLTSIIKKHSGPVQDSSETASVLDDEKFEEDIYETFFKDLSKLGNPEKEGIAAIEKILQAISVN